MACVTPCQQPCSMPKLLGPPHPISGYTGHIPMFKFRSTIGNCGCPSMCPQNPRQSCTKEPITIKFDNEESLKPCCPKGPGYQLRPTPPLDLFEVLTDQRLGQCGCCEFVPPAKTCGFSMASPTFQTILNHPYAPHCNRFCTATFEQDQWRDRLFAKEASKMNAWRTNCKTSSWDRPERLRPWDGDHAEFQEYPNTASPCKLYKQVRAALQKDTDNRNIGDCLKPPFFDDVAQDCRPRTICGPTEAVRLLNREMTGPFPKTILDGLPEILGEHPLLTLHRSAEEREVYSDRFYPEERGLARVCNPKDRSYLTAAPFRCNPVYRCCESVKSSYAGHVPGEQSHLTVGQPRNLSSRNSLKYLTYRTASLQCCRNSRDFEHSDDDVQMFEGKNLHFSPVDNKPLCSYSNKLCRQRRLNGYGFCIRHILEDKSSPFKQCEFVTRNNASRCLNAIPVDQERGYCHSHMQVAGIIPKTERKVKPGANDGSPATSKAKNVNATPTAASPAGKTTNSAQTRELAATGSAKPSVQSPQPLVVPNKSKASSTAQTAVSAATVNNHSITQRVQNVMSGSHGAKSPKIAIITPITVNQNSRPKPVKNNKGASIKIPSPSVKATQSRVLMSSPSGTPPSGTSKVNKKSAKITPFTQPISAVSASTTTTISNKVGQGMMSVKKSTPVVKISVTSTMIPNLPRTRPQSPPAIGISEVWKTFQFNPQDLKQNQKSSSKLYHLNSVRLVEKAPLFNVGSRSAKDKNVALPSDMRIPQRLEINASEPSFVAFSQVQSNKKIEPQQEECTILDETDGLVKKLKVQSNKKIKPQQEECTILDETDGLVKKLTVGKDCTTGVDSDSIAEETKYQARRDFLAKVRKSMKKQCETIQKAYKHYEEEDQYEKTYRTALLTVAEQDASMCAKLLQKPVSNTKPMVQVELPKKPVHASKPKISITATTAKNHPDMKIGNNINLNKTNTIIKTKAGVKSKKEIGTIPPLLPPMADDNTLDHNDSTFITPSGQTCMWNNMPPSNSILKKKNDMPFTGMPKLRNDKIKIKSLTIEHVQLRPNQSSVESVMSKQKKPAVNSKPKRKRKLDDMEPQESTSPKKQSSTKCSSTPHSSMGLGKRQHGSSATAGASSSYESNLNSVGSSDAATTPEGLQDGSFDSPFGSTSSHPECDFSDDDLEQSFDLPIDPDIAQATRLLEDTGFTDEEWNDLFHSSDQKHNGGRTDLSDLGLDFVPVFDTSDIDYSIFSNIFPPFRSTPPDISISQPF